MTASPQRREPRALRGPRRPTKAVRQGIARDPALHWWRRRWWAYRGDLALGPFWTARRARWALGDLEVGAGGRVYLAKDSRVPPDVLAEMYPRLAEFRKLRAELDPAGILASDLSRRLGL